MFAKNVKNTAVEFNTVRSTDGYILGFPGAINDSATDSRVGMINLKINELINTPTQNDEAWIRPYVINDSAAVGENAFNFKNKAYLTSVSSNYSIEQLNLNPGSSGSIFIQVDNANKKIYLNGIYWGIRAVGTVGNPDETNPTVIQSYGQITQFIADGFYNLIGGKTTALTDKNTGDSTKAGETDSVGSADSKNTAKTPTTNAFCEYLKTPADPPAGNRSANAANSFLPAFC